MTVFTVGNLITLAIALLVIFALRYMDRQNRSVDLAREYGKRLKDDIATFAEEKASGVKDYGIELDVLRSAAKEALNRLSEANTELVEKSGSITQRLEDIGRIGERISAYDASMAELIRMSSRVREDMDSLKEDSTLVDATAKKVEGMTARTAELEKDINSLELRFERENAALLEKAVKGLVVEAEGKVEDLRADAEAIERQVEEHRAAVDRLEAERKVKLEKDVGIINTTLSEALEKAKAGAGKLESDSLIQYREEAMARLRQFQDAMEEKLAEYKTDQSAQWKRFETLADDALKLDSQLRATMEAQEAKLRSDLALFEEEQKREQSRVSSSFIEEADGLKNQMAAVEQEFNVLKKRAYDNVSERLELLEDDFFTDLARRSSDIETRLNDWQSTLDKRLVSMGTEAETERHSLELSFKEETKARITEQSERLLSDLERLQIKTAGFEEKIQNSMDETESRISGLTSTADEIRRGLKEFTAQTGLFEKADELKISLERSMETLRLNLSGIEERRAEAARLETEFIKIRRLEDEVNTKMTRFLTEKAHLDVMEKDFERLIETSRHVEERLKEVTGADDTLQNIQVSLRKLEDAVASSEEKYQRIESKNRILEETNRSIERNFQMLEDTELALRKCRENIDRAEDELDTLRPSIENLAAASEKAAYTEEKLISLDTNLTAVEERIEKMQTAREWLARAESRFEELNREAQRELKLLEAVLKDESKKSGGGKGAPPLTVRENVIRLLNQGWTPEAIASGLKISRGEVELIIELEPRNND